MCGHPLLLGDLTRDSTLSKSLLPFFRQLLIASTSSFGSELSVSFHISCWDFIWPEIVWVLGVLSNVHAFICAAALLYWTLFPWSHVLPQALTFFQYVSYTDAWVLERGHAMQSSHLGLSTLQALIRYSFAGCGLCVNHHLMQKEASMMSFGKYINLWV